MNPSRCVETPGGATVEGAEPGRGEPSALEVIRIGRRRRNLRRRVVLGLLTLLIGAAAYALLTWDSDYTLAELGAVIAGQQVPGASFVLGELRIPRTLMGIVVGCCFGMAGVSFQTMLRNPLASPDIIGISAGASAAAVIAIVVFGLSGGAVSVIAVLAGLGIAALCHVLALGSRTAGTRLILVGIGIAAIVNSVISYVLSIAAVNDLQTAARWLSGSLNGASWATLGPVTLALAVFGPLLLAQSRGLAILQLGDDTAAALGERVDRTRLLVIIGAVGLIAFATAATGPIAFVAFLAGPIAARIVGHGSLLIPSALVGVLLVLGAELIGQYGPFGRMPVGVVTGALGAPFLLHLIIRANRHGGTL